MSFFKQSLILMYMLKLVFYILIFSPQTLSFNLFTRQFE